jgi:hypothetical protein
VTDGDINIKSSEQALLQMDNAPDSPAVATTVLVSTWQMNYLAVLCERTFGAKLLRSDGIAKIVSANYTGNSPS